MLTGTGRLAALAVAAGLAVTGCGGGGDETPTSTTATDTASPSGGASGESSGGGSESGADAEPSPSTGVDVPEGITLTEPGARLSFGETARVAHEVRRPAQGRGGKRDTATAGTVLALTVESATKGSLSDLSGFNLSDPYQRKANYFYVRVRVKNLGKHRFGDLDVPLWGISGENTLLPPVRFTSAFAQCPTEPLPVGFAPGARFRTCVVFLSPDKGSLEGVSYRPTETSTPIEWHGKVTAARRDGGTRGRRGSGGG